MQLKNLVAAHAKQMKNRGFTLIELLLVIAILGILATIVFVNLNPAVNIQKTRDTRRATDISQIQNALDQYALANSGQYPAALTSLVPTYLGVQPTDPKTPATNYSYCKNTAGTGYGLGIPLEYGDISIVASSVALGSMSTGCTAAASFSPSIACTAYAATTANALFCVRGGN